MMERESILDHDQVSQIVVKNRVFLRDFLLIIAGLLIFIIIVVFVLLIFNLNKNIEQRQQYEQDVSYTYNRR
ncbi:ORF91 protein [Operophtera brumata nucleopolyhedrovirus]|uniref:ORF91 protein n=1 Tax=Operophtera brumata nucleopolyhedrovirus TaxID=1046267 RepID=A0A2H4UZU0_9ABAC|nr:ORF91 protein [Operophtera brumata nucleopolyhedrovirus]AUA60322.1 ORF91 protein [Operophtera brumata nucleopolyhedrovirus]